jgi:hypothetical protein
VVEQLSAGYYSAEILTHSEILGDIKNDWRVAWASCKMMREVFIVTKRSPD